MRQRVPFGLITACCLLCPTVFLCAADVGAAESAKTGERGDVKNLVKEITAVQPAGAVTGLEPVGVVTAGPVATPMDNIPATGEVPKAKVIAKDAERISVDFYKVDLHNVFRLLGQVSHKNIVVDEKVNGTLTLALQEVPWPFILEVIKNLKDLDSVEKENTILIYPRDKKVEWAKEELGNKGQLEMVDKSLELSQKKSEEPKGAELVIDTQDMIQSPLEDIMKAQEVMARAISVEKRGDVRQARDLYAQASELWPENASLSKKIAALALGRSGDEIMALNYAKKALRIMPKDGEAATLAAVALARMGKAEDARIYFERAMNAENVSMQTLYNYAVFLFSSGAYRDAMRVTNRIETSFTLSPEVMLLKAMCLEALNNPEQAAAEYRAILNAGKGVPAEMLRAAEQRLQAMGRNR